MSTSAGDVPRVLCPVLGATLQEGQERGVGACPEKGSIIVEGSGVQVLGGVSDGTGVV